MLVSGCAHTHTTANAGAMSTTTGGSVSVHSHSLAALILAGMLLSVAAGYESEPPPPEMAADRRVVEHDCTKPLPQTSGNLKCR